MNKAEFIDAVASSADLSKADATKAVDAMIDTGLNLSRQEGYQRIFAIYQAKGIEWRAVFVIWLAEGRFPSFRMDDEEEERRLFYVAVTRARDRLMLVRPEIARDRYRVDTILDPSRFLSELPTEVRELVAIAEERTPDGIDALPGGGRYTLPAFFEDPSDDDIN